MNNQLNTIMTELTTTNLKRVSKDCPHIFLRGRYFIPIEEIGEKTPGILVFFGNHHYYSVPGEFIETLNDETVKNVSAVILREKEEDICEAYEFLSLEVKSLTLDIQALATPYHPNLSVWQLKSIDGFLDELEEEMMREKVKMDEIKKVTEKIMEIGKLVIPKLTLLSEMEDKLQK